jgi:hypothetical protein
MSYSNTRILYKKKCIDFSVVRVFNYFILCRNYKQCLIVNRRRTMNPTTRGPYNEIIKWIRNAEVISLGTTKDVLIIIYCFDL